MTSDRRFAVRLEELTSDDVDRVGGKNASLGEMIRSLGDFGVRVPRGFATTAHAYRTFVEHNDLEDRIRDVLSSANLDDEGLEKAGRSVRQMFTESEFPEGVADAIRKAYRELSERYDTEAVSVAARSSATAEDLPEASFAGQQESFLNLTGEEPLLAACRKCYASLFTDRAIAYREDRGFDHLDIALSVGVQKMVRSDQAGAGVMFTIDTETGFPDVVMINAAWGLGENVVQGTVNPDQYVVYTPFLEDESLRPIIGKTLGEKAKKMVYGSGDEGPTKNVEASQEERERFVLSDDEILRLARWGRVIEEHYGRPMDIEWAKDGERDEIYIVQARPETVQSRVEPSTLKAYSLQEEGERLVSGLAIGEAIATGPVQVILDVDEIDRFEKGAVLVTGMTDPDWVPAMKRAAAVVTDHGGRTSHAAIVSRELGVPAVVGTGEGSSVLEDGADVTVSCVEGDEGHVYEGALEFTEEELELGELPETETTIMMNVATPAAAMRWWRLPCQGVGLARMEYLINNVIKVHPLALTRYDEIEDDEILEEIDAATRGWEDREEFFVALLARGIATIAAAQHPDPVIVRMSDFKTNEYADLLGGSQFEPQEANPMLGWRGASRYYSDDYRDGFALECRAIRRVREEMGFRNVIIMIPFCRTPGEADRTLEVLAENGLERGRKGLEVYVMAEVPSNIIEGEAFAKRFDGFSIGTNDLTQLTLGVDRDNEKLQYLYDEREPSVERLIRQLIERAHKQDRKVGLCGQAPSDHPEFAEFLVEAGIDSISVNPDSVLQVIEHVARAEGKDR
ncbi:MAG: phosphoenolpyruvate synthase [Candidatus Longimicrobiales bacterium M2_2A_002]